MELFIVADHTLVSAGGRKPGSLSASTLDLPRNPSPSSSPQYRNQNLNLGRTKQRIVEIANYVDKVRDLPGPCGPSGTVPVSPGQGILKLWNW